MKSLIRKVVVGLSGGVDSSVSAFLLKEQGYEVSGIYMQNWMADFKDPYCSAEQDLSDARAVCERLNIPFQVVNFSQYYWDRVFQMALDEFTRGRTPNPDIGCNQEIKFKIFLEHALQSGADLIAMGHYAQVKTENSQYQLLKAFDKNKDQSYFLYTLGQEQLSRVIFPLGELTKPQVRDLAQKIGLLNFNKKDSTGICFIGERKFKNFLAEYLRPKPGIIETTEGKEIGRHEGFMYYTLGQRQGLNLGGKKGAQEAPWYVVKKDFKRNVLTVSQNHDDPLLLSKNLTAERVTWISGRPPTLPLCCQAKTRYRQEDQACIIQSVSQDSYHIEFLEAQRAVTPGQSIVFYEGEKCLGGGIISG